MSEAKDFIEILRKVPLFANLAQEESALQQLSEIMKLQKFPAGHTLLSEGELGDEFFVLITGQVSIYKKTPDGDVYKVAILKSDATPALGEGGLIEAEPRTATITCDSDCECLVLTRSQFLQFSETHPAWAVPILKKISIQLMGRLKQTNNDLMLLHKALMNEIRG